MAHGDLRSLKDRLRKALEGSVAALSEEATEADFAKILGSVGALKQLAAQLAEVDRRAALLEAAGTRSSRLDELSGRRRKLVDALDTLTTEMAR